MRNENMVKLRAGELVGDRTGEGVNEFVLHKVPVDISAFSPVEECVAYFPAKEPIQD